ncbi:DUF2018 family protein [Helicobacter sp. MIT 14-3879]|uniref:DUF2018 family protein n=1 Tax=Helicobacter sp. MIT 14-3879 TaxID=2040649 RepID=UPI000E1EC5CC|nr:DUF2018 family protein [Helicobacter sp. MIT 14-3879]RDU64818.1 hypothetical protein CQA44_03665 [Helicobacter sp. MIT 14-3879]
MDIFDELFSSEPMEHLVKILQNASPRAIQNTLDVFFSEYAALSILVEENNLEDKILESKSNDKVKTFKQDLAIRLMSDILSQGD